MPTLPNFMAPLATASAGSGFAGGPTGRVLAGLTLALQEETNWCWAAVTQAVLKFLHGRDVAQEAIATEHARRTGKGYTCAPPKRKNVLGKECGDARCQAGCNDAHFLRIVMNEQGCFGSILSQGAPTFQQIRTEIDAGRPLPCRVQWRPQGGHFILLSGWAVGADGVQRVVVLDPLWNESTRAVVERTMSYPAFVNSYQGSSNIGFINFSYRVV